MHLGMHMGNTQTPSYIPVLSRHTDTHSYTLTNILPEGNDGTEPIITHGHTLCSKIFFRDVIRVCHRKLPSHCSEHRSTCVHVWHH